jgi:hypothetical protein
MVLHPVQQGSSDPVVRGASFRSGSFTVPGRSTVVFVNPGSTPPEGGGCGGCAGTGGGAVSGLALLAGGLLRKRRRAS